MSKKLKKIIRFHMKMTSYYIPEICSGDEAKEFREVQEFRWTRAALVTCCFVWMRLLKFLLVIFTDRFSFILLGDGG